MWVRLNDVWSEAIHDRQYPDAAKRLLGEMLATTALIANNIKHDGGVTLHAVGDGPIKTAFAECQGQQALRGIIRLNEDEPQSIRDDMNFKELIGSSRMALTMQFKTGESYQGLVSTEHEMLEQTLEHYFENSEQLNTTFALNAEEETVTGCFLQRLPSTDLASDMTLAHDEAEWLRLVSLFRTIRPGELGSKGVEGVLRDLFPSDPIQLDQPKTLRFECSCDRDRCSKALQTISSNELREWADEDGGIQVTCEFCGSRYGFLEDEIRTEFNT